MISKIKHIYMYGRPEKSIHCQLSFGLFFYIYANRQSFQRRSFFKGIIPIWAVGNVSGNIC